MANEHRYVLFILSPHLTRIEKDLSVQEIVDLIHDDDCLSNLLAKVLKV